MKAIKYLSIAVFVAGITACSYDVQPEKLYLSEEGVAELTANGRVYHINDFLDAFMTKEGNYYTNVTSEYRTRSHNEDLYPDYWLFTIDTLPTTGPDIYIRGRVTTDDFGGNFYKSLVIQEIVDGKQQNLRLSVDLGSVSGMYPRGQEILIKCNGLAIGRYSNQPQLCVPSYNNNVNAQNSGQKVGWNPGRIPAPICKTHIQRIGLPDEKKLQYDTVTIAQCLVNPSDVNGAWKRDGQLVVIKNIHFTGTQDNYGVEDSLKHYTPGDNESDPTNKDGKADVFAPTTGNIGFPQSRYVSDGTEKILISTSEYAKYANFYIPYEYVNNKAKYGTFKGTVRGVLGFYWDNALREVKTEAEWKAKWSITLCDLNDLVLYADGTGEVPAGTLWGPYKKEDGTVIDLRKEWQKDKIAGSILEDAK